MIARTATALLAFLPTLLLAAPALAQCPMCKAAVNAEDGSGGGLAEGYNVTTLIMFSAPFLLLGIVCLGIYLSLRAARSRMAKQAQAA